MIKIANKKLLANPVRISPELLEMQKKYKFKTHWSAVFTVEWLASGVNLNIPCPWPAGTKVYRANHGQNEETESVQGIPIPDPGDFLALWSACDQLCDDGHIFIEAFRETDSGLSVFFGS